MFKWFLLFLWLFVCIFFWIYVFWDSQENTQLDARYSKYLSGAIVRNTPLYNVEFNTSLFLPQQTQSSQEFIEDINKSEFIITYQNHSRLLSYEQEYQDNNTNSEAISWDSNIPDSKKAELSGLCNGGLIYDPCIILKKPIKTTGWINFGSKKTYDFTKS